MVIALPAGIHPYNRAGGYFDHVANTIVLYQDLGRQALSEPGSAIPTIIHELAHWYQHNALGYVQTSTENIHRHKTWSDVCWLASTRLYPDADLDRAEFNYRRKTGPHLGDVELHHWPRSMPGYLKVSRSATAA